MTLRRNVAPIVLLIAIFTSLLAFAEDKKAATTVGQILSRQQLSEKVELWRRSEEASFSIYFQKGLTVEMQQSAREFTVAKFADFDLAQPIWSLKKELIQVVIHLNLRSFLRQAFYESLIRNYSTLPDFVLGVENGKIKALSIALEDVRAAQKALNCHTIPCDPEECDPDTCGKNVFEMLLNPSKTKKQ